MTTSVRLIHTVYWGGPNVVTWRWHWAWPYLPRAGEAIFPRDGSSHGFTIKEVLWVPSPGMPAHPENQGYVELRTHPMVASDVDHARKLMAELRELGFDCGPSHPWEAE